MASDLATRMPLLESQQRHSQTDQSLHIKTTTITTLNTHSPHHLTYEAPVSLLAHKENILTHLAAQTETSSGSVRSSCSMDDSASCDMPSGSAHSTYVNAGGFRYQIRRPVESWKFVETRKQDGSILYLCRLCGSSYKHKKSLNKHWKDKHTDVPRPQGAQPDDDDDDDEEGDEDGDESDIENIPPEAEVPRTDQFYPSNSSASPTTSILNSSGVTTKPCEPVHRVLLGERAALRRLSAPINRASDKTFHPRRSSYLPDSRLSTEHGNTKPTSQKATLPFKRRFRASESPPDAVAISTVYTTSEQTKHYGPEPTVKRRASVIDPAKILYRNEGGFQLRDLEPIVDGSSFSSIIQSHPHDSGKFQQPLLGVPSDQSLIKQHTTESQPLDLSVLKSNEPQYTSYTSNSGSTAIKRSSSKVGQEIDVSLLIGLLQTALNTLTAEVREASKHSLSGSISSSSLSKTSTSLLLAIGTLLVTMVDKAKESGTAEASLSPNREQNCSSVGTDSASQQFSVSTACRTPSSHVLPPAPSSVLVSPAMETIKSSADENLLAPRMSTIGFYTGSSHENHVQFQYEADTCGTSPNKQDDYPQELIHFSTPNSLRQSGRKSGHGSGSTDPNQLGPCPTGTLRDTNPIQSDLSPLRHPRIQAKSAARLSNGPAADLASKAPRYAEDGATATMVEPQSECQIVCPVCQFDARWFSELRAHMVNHSEHRMFGCCYCPYRAKWKWDVAKHMRRCPLGRHVAHLSNEALLRIVRYHPPPKGNILFNYFPQDGFPGVGLDRPPTPPIVATTEQTGSAPPIQTASYSSVSSRHKSDLAHSPASEPPILTRHEAVTPDSPVHATPQSDSDPDQSPKPLIIVSDTGSEQQLMGSCSVGHTSEKKYEIDSGHNQALFRPHMTDQPECPEVQSPGLVFKLRKCFHCTFHCIDEQEYQSHVQAHRSVTSPSTNNDPQPRVLTTLSSNGFPVLTS